MSLRVPHLFADVRLKSVLCVGQSRKLDLAECFRTNRHDYGEDALRAHDYWSLLVLLSSWLSDTQLVGSGDGIFLILWPAQEIGQGAEWCELGWGAVAGAELPRSPACCRKVNNFAENTLLLRHRINSVWSTQGRYA